MAAAFIKFLALLCSLLGLFAQVRVQDVFPPSISTVNNSIIISTGGATLTMSGCGSSAGGATGVPYSPVVTQIELQARIDMLQANQQAQVHEGKKYLWVYLSIYFIFCLFVFSFKACSCDTMMIN